jgi:hypothetical protein
MVSVPYDKLLHSSPSAVIGRRRNISITPRGERLSYEPPRDRFEGLALGEDFQITSSLSYEEKKDC